MGKNQVSIVRYANQGENIRKAVEMCGGLKGLKTSDRVVLKPNVGLLDVEYPFPKFGVVTTTTVVAEVVKMLKEFGCSRIAIAENVGMSVLGSKDTMRDGRNVVYNELGYYELQKKYGVELLDVDEGPFTTVDFGKYSLKIFQPVLDADFLIDLPVLKTHQMTKVSLGFKNLKGSLAVQSRRLCHNKNFQELPLDSFIYNFATKIDPDLTIIDGIYSLERGPMVGGKPHYADIIIASQDMFSADVIGTKAMGIDPDDIGTYVEYANKHNRLLDGSDIEILGERVEDVTIPIEWEQKWNKDNSAPVAFERLGISGVNIPKYDETICSICGPANILMITILMDAFKGDPFKNIEILSGKVRRSQGGYDKTFLLGKCAIDANLDNPAIKEAVKIKGCPPRFDDIIKVFNENGVEASMDGYVKFRTNVIKRNEGRDHLDENDEKHYTVALD